MRHLPPARGRGRAARHDQPDPRGYQRLDASERKGAGYLVNYYGRSVLDVDTAWHTMLVNLGLPTTREWKPYLLRHSLSTIARNRGVAKWDLEGFMGHDASSTTEIYAVSSFDTVKRALEEVLGEIDARASGAFRRTSAEVALSGHFIQEKKMTG